MKSKNWKNKFIEIIWCIKNRKDDGYQSKLALMVYKFFHKKNADGAVKNKSMQNKEIAEEISKPVIKKIEKRKVYSSFIDNILGADLADMQL